jgi:hypothetical protein
MESLRSIFDEIPGFLRRASYSLIGMQAIPKRISSFSLSLLLFLAENSKSKVADEIPNVESAK